VDIKNIIEELEQRKDLLSDAQIKDLDKARKKYINE
jgi:hypothetical protein